MVFFYNKNIKNSFGGNDGIENFKKSWKIDQVNSPLWETLGTVLALGYNVKDIRTDQKTTDMTGTVIEAFTSWQIKGTVISGSASGVTSNTTGDLNDIISLSLPLATSTNTALPESEP